MADHLKKLEKELTAINNGGVDTVVDGEVATITLKATNAFIETLPEGLSEELVKTYEAHKANFAVAAVHVIGTHGNETFALNPEVKRVEARVALYGNQHFDVFGHRETGEGKSLKYGDYALVMHTAVEDGGTLAKVFKNLSSEAKSALSKATEK